MTRPSGHLLVTGFGPFPGMAVNQSAVLARRVADHPRLTAVRPRLLVLRTAYESIETELVPALDERPAAVLMFGVASRAKRVRVETRAINRANRLYPDASGRVSSILALERGGPAQRRGAVAATILVRLRSRGIDAGLSRDAGRYLCNASYFRALREDCPVLFLHIPPFRREALPRGPRMDRLVEVAVDVAILMMSRGRAT